MGVGEIVCSVRVEIVFLFLFPFLPACLPAWMLLQIILNASDKVEEREEGRRVD